MGCFINTLQFIFFSFNYLFFYVGIVAFGFGIFNHVKNGSWKDLVDSNSIFQIADSLIIGGFVITTIGFCGCCGAYRKSTCMLLWYGVLVVIIFLIEISVGVYTYLTRTTIQEALTTRLSIELENNYGIVNTSTTAIDWFQDRLQCCGTIGPKDWDESEWIKTKNTTLPLVPRTCCTVQSYHCNIIRSYNSSAIFHGGCVEKGKTLLMRNFWWLTGLLTSIAFVQLFGIVSSIMLFKSYKNTERIKRDEYIKSLYGKHCSCFCRKYVHE